MIFSFPKYLKSSDHIEDFLAVSEKIFTMQRKQIPNVIIECSRVRDISIIGVLLLYKFIDYTYLNYCFKSPSLNGNDILVKAWQKYGFKDLMNAYISNKDITEKAYKQFKVKVDENFIIAPQPLLRGNSYSRESLQNDFLPKIEKYYSHNSKISDMIFLCLSEILLNFWEHAQDDQKSILVADGTKTKIEIACADNGEGIITSLLNCDDYKNVNPSTLIQKAVQQGVTSKPNSDHMGYGLWIIDKIVSLTNGKLNIYSEGYFYTNEYGKVKKGYSSYWKGTILYLYLPLEEPVTLSDIYNLTTQKSKFNNLKINFV